MKNIIRLLSFSILLFILHNNAFTQKKTSKPFFQILEEMDSIRKKLIEKGYEVHGTIRRSSSFNTSRIEGLISKVYHGSWKKRPDFSKLEPKATYEEHKGLISIANAGNLKSFGMVWEGQIAIARKGNYTFTLDSDDGSAIYIDDKLVTEIKGLGGMGRAKSGKTKKSKTQQ